MKGERKVVQDLLILASYRDTSSFSTIQYAKDFSMKNVSISSKP